MSKKPRKVAPKIEPVVTELRLKGKRRGGLLKEEIWQEDGKVTKYNLVYINPEICAQDNGRVLGYDCSHGYHHRHFMGKEEPVKFEGFERLVERFRAEVKDLWRKEDEQDD
jgi:hypothetical protein